MKSVLHRSFLLYNGHRTLTSKMSSKEFQNDGAACRSSSELLSQSDVDNDNGHDDMPIKSPPCINYVITLGLWCCGFSTQCSISRGSRWSTFQNWFDWYTVWEYQELNRPGWNTREEGVFQFIEQRWRRPDSFPVLVQRYRLSSLQGECLLLLDSIKDSESATVLRFKLDGMSYLIGRLFLQ